MPDLKTIVYTSIAVRLMSDAELEALLITARNHNQELGVTGVLLYGGGNFMQCLEGPEDAVAAVFKRIQDSTKHRRIIKLMDEAIDYRRFADWQMGFAKPTASELLTLSTANWTKIPRDRDLPPVEGIGLNLLQGFWKSCQTKPF